MVFAVWACRPGAARPDWTEAFLGSCRYGLEHVEDIVRAEAAPRGLSEALAREYLTHRVALELGEREYEGMRLFVEYARQFDTLVSSEGARA